MSELDRRGIEYVKARMPVFGVGTYQVRSESVLYDTIDEALTVGYRLIDTAQIYRNEHIIGNILPGLLDKHNLKWEDIFITSKVSPANQGKDKCRKSLLKSLEDLKTTYLDLILIHWPASSRLNSKHKDNLKLRMETYQVLEELMDEGKVRAIGVSNYEVKHLEQLLAHSRILPAVNQCECHPHFPNELLARWCKDKGIHFQTYSSLGGPDYVETLLNDQVIKKIADDHQVTAAVILLAWPLCLGYSTLPRTEKVERIRENWKATNIVLREDEMSLIASIPTRHKACWDPSVIA